MEGAYEHTEPIRADILENPTAGTVGMSDDVLGGSSDRDATASGAQGSSFDSSTGSSTASSSSSYASGSSYNEPTGGTSSISSDLPSEGEVKGSIADRMDREESSAAMLNPEKEQRYVRVYVMAQPPAQPACRFPWRVTDPPLLWFDNHSNHATGAQRQALTPALSPPYHACSMADEADPFSHG